MGLDIQIQCLLQVCKETGKPFYYSNKNNFKKIYDLSSITVPEEFRKFLYFRGHFYTAYIEDWKTEQLSVDMETFKENFPQWAKVKEWKEEYDINDDEWSMDDHLAFQEAIDWFASTDIPFQVSWSY